MKELPPYATNFETLYIRKEDRGLFFKHGPKTGWLKDSLSLADLVHNLKPYRVKVLDKGETPK